MLRRGGQSPLPSSSPEVEESANPGCRPRRLPSQSLAELEAQGFAAGLPAHDCFRVATCMHGLHEVAAASHPAQPSQLVGKATSTLQTSPLTPRPSVIQTLRARIYPALYGLGRLSSFPSAGSAMALEGHLCRDCDPRWSTEAEVPSGRMTCLVLS